MAMETRDAGAAPLCEEQMRMMMDKLEGLDSEIQHMLKQRAEVCAKLEEARNSMAQFMDIALERIERPAPQLNEPSMPSRNY